MHFDAMHLKNVFNKRNTEHYPVSTLLHHEEMIEHHHGASRSIFNLLRHADSQTSATIHNMQVLRIYKGLFRNDIISAFE